MSITRGRSDKKNPEWKMEGKVKPQPEQKLSPAELKEMGAITKEDLLNAKAKLQNIFRVNQINGITTIVRVARPLYNGTSFTFTNVNAKVVAVYENFFLVEDLQGKFKKRWSVQYKDLLRVAEEGGKNGSDINA